MPLGESIGDAYVRVHANGDDVRVGINDSFDGLGGDLNRRGREGGEAYRRGWGEELNLFRADLARSLNDNLTDFSRGLDGNRVALTGADSRVERLRVSLGELADQVEANDGRWSAFTNNMRDSSSEMDLLRARLRGTSDALGDADSNAARLGGSTRRLTDDTDRLSDSSDRSGRSFGFLRETTAAFFNVVRSGTGNTPALISALRRMGDEGDRNNRVFGRLTGHMHGFADTVGRGFGRGSRNDFINFIGSFARGLVRLIALLPKVIDLVVTFASELSKKMAKAAADAGGGIEGFGAAVVALGEELIALGPVGLAIAAAAIAAFVLAIVPMVAILSSAAAAVTALAASITFGLIGALAPLVGLIAPIGLGLGVMAVGFFGVKKRADELKSAVKPLGNAFKDLSKIAGNQLLGSITRSLSGLKPVVKSLEPLVRNVSKALGGVMESFADAVKGPGFNEFINKMSVFVPKVMTALGEIIQNTFGGLGGVFLALRPVTNQFLDWLTEITDKFNEWANSAQGREELRAFFDDARDSAKALGDVVRAVAGFLGELFRSGRKDGDDLLHSLAKNVDKFREWMQTAEGKRSLKQWFEDGREFARTLGEVVVQAGKVWRAIDSPAARNGVRTVLQVVGAFAGLAAKVITFTGQISGALRGGLIGAFRAFGTVAGNVLGFVGGAFRYLWNGVIAPVVRFLLHGFSQIIAGFANVLHALGKVPGFEWAERAADKMDAAAAKADALANSIRDIPLTKRIDITTYYHTVRTPSEMAEDRKQAGGSSPLRAGGITPGGASSLSVPTSTGNSRTINNNWNITTQNADPRAAAVELLNHMVATAY